MLGFFSNNIINKKKIEKQKFKILDRLFSNFISYSQHFEDFILFYLFYDIDKGFYIDIGANDPNIFSVTKAFYERGWHGINIEPLPNKFNLLKKFRPRDINLNIGAGKKEMNSTFMSLGVFSSLFYNKTKKNLKIIPVTIKKMSNICKEYVPKGLQIEFLKIDVESSEKDVLLGFDFINFRPKIICIESLLKPVTLIPEYIEWEEILIKNSYNFAYKYELNRFYYDNKVKGLKEKFIEIDSFVKIYKKKNNNIYKIL